MLVLMKDWEAAYANGETPWDKGRAAPPLVDFLRKRPIAGKVLVPGCGTGHDVRLLARQGATVVGVDIAQGALRKAQAFSSVSDERYELADFLNLPDEFKGQFDWVFEHTCLCAIEPGQREAYAKSVGASLKSRGHFLAIFFREVSDYDGYGPPHPIAANEIEALFSESFERVESFVPKDSYPSRSYGCEEVVLFRKRA